MTEQELWQRERWQAERELQSSVRRIVGRRTAAHGTPGSPLGILNLNSAASAGRAPPKALDSRGMRH